MSLNPKIKLFFILSAYFSQWVLWILEIWHYFESAEYKSSIKINICFALWFWVYKRKKLNLFNFLFFHDSVKNCVTDKTKYFPKQIPNSGFRSMLYKKWIFSNPYTICIFVFKCCSKMLPSYKSIIGNVFCTVIFWIFEWCAFSFIW